MAGFGESDEAIAKAAKTCLKLTPEQEEGPFYVELGNVRSNIVEASRASRWH